MKRDRGRFDTEEAALAAFFILLAATFPVWVRWLCQLAVWASGK